MTVEANSEAVGGTTASAALVYANKSQRTHHKNKCFYDHMFFLITKVDDLRVPSSYLVLRVLKQIPFTIVILFVCLLLVILFLNIFVNV